MIELSFNNIAISGLASCVPENVETLEKYNSVFGKEAVDKFTVTTGVKCRHMAIKNQTSSDLAFIAADKLLNFKGISRNSVGALVFITQTPDYRLPATAYVLQSRLGLSQNCICFDVNHGCCGYVYGLGILSSIMTNSNIDFGVLLTGVVVSKYMAPKDKSVCMLMADAGTATLLEKKNTANVLSAVYKSDGESFKSVIIPAGASRNTDATCKRSVWNRDGNERSDYDLFMDGMEIFSYGITNVPKIVKEYLAAAGKGQNDYDGLVMHQANLYLMKQIAKRIGFPDEKIPVSVDRYGNTSVNSIPLSIVDAYQAEPDINKSLLLCGFGGGMSLGVVDMKINTTDIFPMIYSNDYYTEGGISHD